MTAAPSEHRARATLSGPRLELEPIDPRRAAPLPFDLTLTLAGINVAVRSLFRRVLGWKRYPGTVEAIARAVVEDCWTGEFFAGSAGHFNQFWTRDLAICTPALCRLGERERVVRSWTFGLERFERAGRITTTIFRRRSARDVYAFGSDSLPLLLWGLREAGADHLVERHRDLLTREIERYHARVLDPDLGLARTDGYFSGPRDCMTGRSTVFANTMLAVMAQLLEDEPRLPNPFRGYDFPAAMLAQHWTGDSFRDALDRELPSGDANVWPFFFGLFPDTEMRRRAFATIEARGLAKPIPLAYFERRLPGSELPVPRLFTPNYQGDTCWTQLGPAYLAVLGAVDRSLMVRHRAAMAALIERDGNYLELYEKSGRPYRGRAFFYHADEGMLWAAMFLDLFAGS
jgi:hypothetical protein